MVRDAGQTPIVHGQRRRGRTPSRHHDFWWPRSPRGAALRSATRGWSQPTMRLWAEAITIGDLVDRRPPEPTADALVFPDGRATYSGARGAHRPVARARCARSASSRDDKVGILMPNRLDFVAALVGAAKLGAVAVPVNGALQGARAEPRDRARRHPVLLCAAGPEGDGRLSRSSSRGVFPDAAGRTESRSSWSRRRCCGSSCT